MTTANDYAQSWDDSGVHPSDSAGNEAFHFGMRLGVRGAGKPGRMSSNPDFNAGYFMGSYFRISAPSIGLQVPTDWTAA